MRNKTKAPVFYFRPKSLLFILPFITLVIGVIFYTVRPTEFVQPEVQSFAVACPTIALKSGGVDAQLQPSIGYSEGSGMVASRKNPGIYWVHGDELITNSHAAIWAISERGEFIARYDIPPQFTAFDTEDIAVGRHPTKPGDFIYLAAFGDNNGSRGQKSVLRFEEPLVTTDNNATTEIIALDASGVESVQYTYQKVAGTKYYDAEGLLVDPTTGNLYIFSKNLVKNRGEELISMVFKMNADDFSGRANPPVITLGPVAAIRGKTPSAKGQNGPTAVDITPDGQHIVLANRSELFYWHRKQGTSVEEALINRAGVYGATEPCKSGDQAQNPESVAFTPDGKSLLTINEQFNSRIYKYSITFK